MLKKLAAILLLFVFLFSLFGYQYLVVFLSHKADQRLETFIDNEEYNDADLVEIRVPLNMPYQQRFTEFERHYGSVTLEGKTYNYVKRKVDGDWLILKCIPNETRQQLKNTADDLAKANSNNQPDNNKQQSSLTKVFSADYDDNTGIAFATCFNLNDRQHIPIYTDVLADVRLSTPHQPPQQA